jgi:adenosylcobinamide amidohydrolase
VSDAFSLERSDRFLHLDFAEPHDCLSWAIVGGGRQRATRVTWCQVSRGELPEDADPRALVESWIAEERRASQVVLMTSRNLDAFELEVARDGEWSATCLATVGLGNALRPGDSAQFVPPVGTINLGVVLSHRLSEGAALEALSLATAARSLAVSEAGVTSEESGAAASGTGTDCVLIASPATGTPLPWVGMHTKPGELLGRCVLEATRRGVEAWLQKNGRLTLAEERAL